jgi:hypothetical protein
MQGTVHIPPHPPLGFRLVHIFNGGNVFPLNLLF